MFDARLHLTDPALLRSLMRWGPGGRSLDVRGLATRVGVSKSKVGALLSGERPTVTQEIAERICSVLDVRRDALFFEQCPRPRARTA
ncbi:helix-turn-helix domain-containing protein [Streptomyces sp. NPDC008125]|uniref:helix-turn-helix domain-containing protein n=1 Tax=Streptomyces sp. NPDC008125 TaxID=3364811 RepID=UPI0036E7F2C2